MKHGMRMERGMQRKCGGSWRRWLAGVLAAVNDFNPADMADRVERLRRHLRGEEDESRLLH